ncbi:MAG: class I SAM-dependent methyltransferase [Firmicutes bacterium]|nr:class I SAM-dependent methyltransferase [Bacillota bacterium]
MALNWMKVDKVSFNSLLLLERVQLTWLPGWVDEENLATALRANPAVEWFMRHKCPEISSWLDKVLSLPTEAPVREAELAVLSQLEDLLVYALDPDIYDAQPFLNWDNRELTELVDFAGKTVIDVGAGTGRLTLVALEHGATVYAVEPVANLRAFLLQKTRRQTLDKRLFVVDGLITRIPFADKFADVVMGGHVFGDAPDEEYAELLRVVRPGGMIVLCPGNNDKDNAAHKFLVETGFQWSRFEQPRDGIKRKYWKIV